MGCVQFLRCPVEDGLNADELVLLERINSISIREDGKISREELQVIKNTLNSVHCIEDEERKAKWIETINSELIAPVYFGGTLSIPYPEGSEFHPTSVRFHEIMSKDYPTLYKTTQELKENLLYIFYDLIQEFSIDFIKFQRFVHAIAQNYLDNPFHNFYHAFDVVRLVYVISERNEQFAAFLTPVERLALFLSALGHDLHHPGVNNPFLINSGHPLAIRYNDVSVLENHHVATLMKILSWEGCDILDVLSESSRNSIRKLIIPTILATDMVNHNKVVEAFKSTMQHFDKGNPVHRQIVMDTVLHAVDIGNPALKFNLATLWSLRIIKEFHNQVWKEEEQGLPISEHLRAGEDLPSLKKSQMGFIQVFILPLWELLGSYIPNIQDFVESIEINRRQWEVIEKI